MRSKDNSILPVERYCMLTGVAYKFQMEEKAQVFNDKLKKLEEEKASEISESLNEKENRIQELESKIGEMKTRLEKAKDLVLSRLTFLVGGRKNAFSTRE